MVLFWTILLLTAVTGLTSSKATHKIINGDIATRGQFPYQVSIRDGNMHFCGGSILDHDTILTAAHCVSLRTPDVITVVAGSLKLDSGGDVYKVRKIINHENWTESNAMNDIALLKLSSSINFNEDISVIEIETDEVVSGTESVVSGWGLTDPNGENSNDLRYLRVHAIDYLECRIEQPENNPLPIESSHICGLNQLDTGVCNQDSGGPFAANGKQIGIVSWSNGCAQDYADVYTKVSFYKNWINSHK